MKKIVLIVLPLVMLALIAIGFWTRGGGKIEDRQITTEAVQSHYQEEVRMWNAWDGQGLCGNLAEVYQGEDDRYEGHSHVRVQMDKTVACDTLRQQTSEWQRIAEAAGNKAQVDLAIMSIQIPDPGTVAIVDSTVTLRIGTHVQSWMHRSEQLIQNDGRIHVVRGRLMTLTQGSGGGGVPAHALPSSD